MRLVKRDAAIALSISACVLAYWMAKLWPA
jgi:hypothetical protein